MTYNMRYSNTSTPGYGCCSNSTSHQSNTKGSRTAILLRTWDGFDWTEDDARNVQGMVSEMSALGQEFAVHILLHLKHDLQASPESNEDIEAVKSRHVPAALVNITNVWTYDDCREAYSTIGEHE